MVLLSLLEAGSERGDKNSEVIQHETGLERIQPGTRPKGRAYVTYEMKVDPGDPSAVGTREMAEAISEAVNYPA